MSSTSGVSSVLPALEALSAGSETLSAAGVPLVETPCPPELVSGAVAPTPINQPTALSAAAQLINQRGAAQDALTDGGRTSGSGVIQADRSPNRLARGNSANAMDLLREIDPAQLTITRQRRLGEGSFGVVYEGEYVGEKVAVKEFRDLTDPREFSREFQLHFNLFSRRIVQLYGACTRSQPFKIVMELMAGHLKNLIDKQELQLKQQVRILREVSEGLQFLHGRGPIFHRDVKSTNILVKSRPDNEGWVKLADFGQAVLITNTVHRTVANLASNQPTGSFPWMAPEIMRMGQYTAGADMYSFGNVCWEVITRKTPYANASSALMIIHDVCEKGNRLEIPASCPAILRDIMKGCWLEEPSERLSAVEVVLRLREFEKGLNADPRPAPTPVTPLGLDWAREREGFLERKLENGHTAFLTDLAKRIFNIVVAKAKLEPAPSTPQQGETSDSPRNQFGWVADTIRANFVQGDHLQQRLTESDFFLVQLMPDVIAFWIDVYIRLSRLHPQPGAWPQSLIMEEMFNAFNILSEHRSKAKFQEMCRVADMHIAEVYRDEDIRNLCFWMCPASYSFRQTPELWQGFQGGVPWGFPFWTREHSTEELRSSPGGTFLLRLCSRPWPQFGAGQISISYRDPENGGVQHSLLPARWPAVRERILGQPHLFQSVFGTHNTNNYVSSNHRYFSTNRDKSSAPF